MTCRTTVRATTLGGLLALAACGDSALAPGESIESPELPDLALRSPLVYTRCDGWEGDPDGEAACVGSAMVIIEPERGERYLFLKRHAGGYIDSSPAWSPDGRTIAFTGYWHCEVETGRYCPSEIYLIRPDGTGLTRLTHSPSTWNYQPAWSPDSRKIAYAVAHEDSFDLAPRLSVVHLDGSGATSLGGLLGSGPAWSTDGKRIAFSARSATVQAGIHVADADGSNLTRLTGAQGWSDSQPAWSPDGRTIAFTRSAAGSCQVWVMGADGSNPLALTKGSSCAMAPAWTPDGKLAFNSDRSILVMNADGTGLSHVRSLIDMGWPSRVSWAPLP